MNLNLSLLLPEWVLCGFLLLLMLQEIVTAKSSAAGSFRLPLLLLGPLAAGMAAVIQAGTIGTAFGGMFVLDPFASFFKIFFCLAGFLVILMSRDFFQGRPGKHSEFYLILYCLILGLLFLSSANDLLVFFVALEIIALSFYILASYLKKELISIEAGLKYLITGSLASAFTIYGISLIYAAAGGTSFAIVKGVFASDPHHPLLLLGLLMILSGIGFKIAAVPFQFWVPDVYEGAPTPVVSFLSVASKAAGFAILLRLLFTVFPSFDSGRSYLFSLLAVMTLLYGNLAALVQTHIKRLFGYSSIGHAGYLLMGIAAGGENGITSVLYYLVAYGLTMFAAFFIITLIGRELKSDHLSAYTGLGKRSPFLAGVFFLALLSLAGVPPLAGFFGKLLVLLAAVQNGLAWLALLGALAVAVSLFYYLSIVRTMYFEPSGTESQLRIEPSLSTRYLLIGLSTAILVIGVWQEPVLRLIKLAVYSLG